MNNIDFKYFSLWEGIYIKLYFLLKKLFDLLPTHIILERNILLFRILPKYETKYYKKKNEYIVQIENTKYILRKNTSDILVFNQIIIENEYEPIKKHLEAKKIIPKYIIDCGANIGISTLYMKNNFPNAKLIAIEPFLPNFNQLKKNCESNQLTDVYLLKTGVWGIDMRLTFNKNFRDNREWSVQLTEKDDHKVKGEIEAHTIGYYMQQFRFPYIDILKMDIEGGEVSVFLQDRKIANWLAKTNIIAIEIHDEYHCREDIENILIQNNFELSHHHELTICINKKWNY